MTHVSFYLISATGSQSLDTFACRLAEKAYRLGNPIYLHAEDAQHAQQLDELLWTFRDGSFVPHDRLGVEGWQADTQVLIGHSQLIDQIPARQGLIINRAQQLPTLFSRFDRLAELVDGDQDARTQSRQRYQWLKDRGYHLQVHNL